MKTIENEEEHINIKEFEPSTTSKQSSFKTDAQQESLRYEENDIGPYIVIVQSIDSDNKLGNYHPMAIAQILIDQQIQGIKSIKRQGANKIAVELTTYADANNLLHNAELREKGYKSFVPFNMMTCKGLVRGVATHFTEEQVIKYINSPFPVIGLRRIMKKTTSEESKKQKATLDNSATLKPTGMIVFTFKGKILPRHIQICMMDLEVTP